MAELLEAIASPPALVLAILIFGVAPGVVLRGLLMVYPPDHPRRRELYAELAVVPRVIRPLWVAEQLEVVLFEAVPIRWAARARGGPGHCVWLDGALALITLAGFVPIGLSLSGGGQMVGLSVAGLCASMISTFAMGARWAARRRAAKEQPTP